MRLKTLSFLILKRKAVHELLSYYRNNRCRMNYARYRDLGLLIGSVWSKAPIVT